MHKEMMARLRPLPFQYVWCFWYLKTGNENSSYDSNLTLLADRISDIGAFYRIYNNFPWNEIRLKDSVHIFRAGVKPLWEDPENGQGGCWVVKVRKEEGRPEALWEEICLLGCGGELQSVLSSGMFCLRPYILIHGLTRIEHDHVLGLSFSPRPYWTHISIWTKQGNNTRSVELLDTTILQRISTDLKPKPGEYYYKKHSDHEGWKGEDPR